jgi:GTP-binding protein EngB required for normal cell division
LQYLYQQQLRTVLLGTKADKLSRVQLAAAAQRLATGFRVGAQDIVLCSAVTGMGKDSILELIWSMTDDK